MLELELKTMGVMPIELLLLGVLTSLFSNGLRVFITEPMFFDRERIPAEMAYLFGTAELLLNRSNMD